MWQLLVMPPVRKKNIKIKRFLSTHSLKDHIFEYLAFPHTTSSCDAPSASQGQCSNDFRCLFTTDALEHQHTSKFKAYKKLNAPIILNWVCSVLLEPVHSFHLLFFFFPLFCWWGEERTKYFKLVLQIGSWSNSIIAEWLSSLWADSQRIIKQD